MNRIAVFTSLIASAFILIVSTQNCAPGGFHNNSGGAPSLSAAPNTNGPPAGNNSGEENSGGENSLETTIPIENSVAETVVGEENSNSSENSPPASSPPPPPPPPPILCPTGEVLAVSPHSQVVSPIPVVNQSVWQNMSATGGTPPYTWTISAGAHPPGYRLSTSGVWSGTVTTEGTYTATVQARDARGCIGTATYTWPVGRVVISPASTTITGISVGMPVHGAMSATGGNGPYRFTVESGTLPPGYVLDSVGNWSGTVQQAGNFTVTIRVTDIGGAHGFSRVTYTWIISP